MYTCAREGRCGEKESKRERAEEEPMIKQIW